MRRLLKNWRLLATLAVVAAIAAVAFRPTPAVVDVAAVTRGPLTVTLDDEGETRVKDRFVISAPVAGQLQRIDWEPGDAVQQGGSVVARITPAAPVLIDARTRAELRGMVDAAEAALGQARAERQKAVAALDRARSTLKRAQSVSEVGAVSRDELEQGETTVRTAEEALRAADFGVSRALYDLQTARARLQQPAGGGRTIDVVSPIDGVVLKRMRESASVVAAGEPLLEVGDASRLEVVADFLSTDAVRIKPGHRVLLEQWGGGHELVGRVQRVEPSGFMKVSALGVEEQRVNVIIDFEDAAGAARLLGDGYRVEVRVVVWEHASVLKVPVSALFRRGEDWAVFVSDAGVARLRRVTTGQRSEREAEVTTGLAEGETVVVHPPDSLQEGMTIARGEG